MQRRVSELVRHLDGSSCAQQDLPDVDSPRRDRDVQGGVSVRIRHVGIRPSRRCRCRESDAGATTSAGAAVRVILDPVFHPEQGFRDTHGAPHRREMQRRVPVRIARIRETPLAPSQQGPHHVRPPAVRSQHERG